jgi:hypothetical protein
VLGLASAQGTTAERQRLLHRNFSNTGATAAQERGLIGAGRSELACALFGIDPRQGDVVVNGTLLAAGSVPAALRAGLCLVPENRKEQGLILDFSIEGNIALPNLAALTKGGQVDRKAETELARAGEKRLGLAVLVLVVGTVVAIIHQNGEGNRSGEYRRGENAFWPSG